MERSQADRHVLNYLRGVWVHNHETRTQAPGNRAYSWEAKTSLQNLPRNSGTRVGTIKGDRRELWEVRKLNPEGVLVEASGTQPPVRQMTDMKTL